MSCEKFNRKNLKKKIDKLNLTSLKFIVDLEKRKTKFEFRSSLNVKR